MDLHDLISSEVKLPPSPQILPKLQTVLNDQECSVFDVVSIVKMEASLMAKVLQASNSAFYGMAEPCKSLEDAVNRIGVQETYKIVAMSVANEAIGEGLPFYGMGQGELLEQSLVAAVLMTEIATRKPWLDTESAYTIGLLHGLGKVVINQFLSERGANLYDLNVQGPLNLQEEYALLGFNFTQAGAALLAQWKFPEEVYQPIAYQYHPLSVPAGSKSMACLLTMAISAIYVVQQEEKTGKIEFSGNPEIMKEIPIDEQEFLECMTCARETFADIREMLANI